MRICAHFESDEEHTSAVPMRMAELDMYELLPSAHQASSKQ